MRRQTKDVYVSEGSVEHADLESALIDDAEAEALALGFQNRTAGALFKKCVKDPAFYKSFKDAVDKIAGLYDAAK